MVRGNVAPPRAAGSDHGHPAEAAAGPGLGIYVHWPFCLAKCPYCDFNSHVRDRVDEARWRRALLSELDHYAALTPGRAATSLFFGGGTPSLMDPATAAAVIERVRAHWPAADEPEITLEANPGAAEAERFAAFREAGVNRVSIGVQALDDAALRFLGRIHGRAEAVAAVERAQGLFPRVSFDLIYARPRQDLAAWRAELREALTIAGGHLSLYQLTIEPGTAFHTAARLGALTLPEEDAAAALYETTAEMLEAAGLPAYEISNHARRGEECRHNLTYWRYGDYVGAGPGAHGRLTLGGVKHATRQRRLPEAWLAAVEAQGHATDERMALSPHERAEEALMMGLRLCEGVSDEMFREACGLDLDEVVPPERTAPLEAAGLVVRTPERLVATKDGRAVLDALLARLLA